MMQVPTVDMVGSLSKCAHYDRGCSFEGTPTMVATHLLQCPYEQLKYNLWFSSLFKQKKLYQVLHSRERR